MLRNALGIALLGAVIGLTGCDRGSDTTTTTPPSSSTPTPSERAQDTANRAADTVRDTANNATADTQPATSSSSNLPGLPSVNGTSVKGLSTADAAATRLLDNAKNNLDKGDTSKAKTLLDELKGMYNSLSPNVKSQVDELETKLNGATPPTTK